MSKHEAPFIVKEGFVDWFNLGIPMYYCEFVQENYRDPLFAQLKVPFSNSLNGAVVKRRAEFLAGRYCATQAMRVHGVDEQEVKIGKHRNPLWPAPLMGSISHSGNVAAAITCNSSLAYGIGIDIEVEVDATTMESLSPQILCGGEQAFIEAQSFLLCGDKRQSCLLFTLIFSIKESFFKAAYSLVADYFDFDAISVIALNWSTRTIQFCINKTLHQHLEKGTIFDGSFFILPDGKTATLVMLGK